MPTLVEQAPVLLVKDVEASIAYWRDRLGFAVRAFGEPTNFAIGRRDRCFIMLSQAPADHTIVPNWHVVDKLWNAYFWVDDAAALHEEFVKAGARIDYAPGRQPYDVIEFGIQDLDGHDIAFGQDLG